MGKLLRSMTKRGYKHAVKPILFLQKPDNVHKQLLVASKTLQSIPLLNKTPAIWSYGSPKLKQTIHGVTFRNPIGLSAGFDKNIEMLPTMHAIGFGFETGGSITAQPCDGNPRPWFHRLPKSQSLVVYAGLPNAGTEHVLPRLEKYATARQNGNYDGFPLIASVAKTNSKEAASDEEAIDDYCISLRMLEEKQVCQLYEINISCPNTYGGEPFNTPPRLERLLSAIDTLQLTKPVFIKMPIDKPWSEFKKLLNTIVKHNVQGVSIGNLLKDRSLADLKDELSPETKGNLSGKPCWEVSTELVRRTYKAYGSKLTIIGTGGVFSAEDAYAKIRAGATLVGMITGLIYEGPQVVGDINRGLVELLSRDGYENVSHAIGADVV